MRPLNSHKPQLTTHISHLTILLGILLLITGALTGPLEGRTQQIGGRTYIDLQEVAGHFGMKAHWLEKPDRMRLKSQWTTMDFQVDKRDVHLNKTRIHLGDPIAQEGNRLYLSKRDLETSLQPILTPQIFSSPPVVRKIVLDPGHGGKDSGARNPGLGLYEKHLTLDVAERLAPLLRSQGFEVFLTRNSDEFVSLTQRAAFANKVSADLFLSIHFNAVGNKNVRGFETYAFTPLNQPSTARSSLHFSDRKQYPGNQSDPWNALLAYYVQRSLTHSLKSPDRGLKRARFTVLRDIQMPGILLEGGFVSHENEGRNIGSGAYRQKFAEAITQGVLTYQKTIRRLRN